MDKNNPAKTRFRPFPQIPEKSGKIIVPA